MEVIGVENNFQLTFLKKIILFILLGVKDTCHVFLQPSMFGSPPMFQEYKFCLYRRQRSLPRPAVGSACDLSEYDPPVCDLSEGDPTA